MPSEPSGLSSAKRPMLSPVIFGKAVTESPGNATAWAAPVRIGEGRFIRATLGSRQSLVGLKSRELINVSLRSLDSGSIRPRRGFVASGGPRSFRGGLGGGAGGEVSFFDKYVFWPASSLWCSPLPLLSRMVAHRAHGPSGGRD